MKKRVCFSIFAALVLGSFVFAQNAENTTAEEALSEASEQVSEDEDNAAEENVSAAGKEESASEKKSGCSLPFVSFFTPEPEYSLAVREKADNYHNFELFTLNFGIIFQADLKELSGRTGVNFAGNKIDLSLDVRYGPIFFKQLQAGPRIIVHYDWYHNYYVENDFLAGGFVSYKPLSWLKTEFSAFYQLKSTDVYAIKEQCPWFYSNCPALEWKTTFYPLNWLTIEGSMSSFSFFKYFLFFSPDFRICAIFKANSHLSMSITTEAQFVDFFTLSANFNSLSTSISAIWRF